MLLGFTKHCNVRCEPEYFGFPDCQPCSCPSTAKCDETTGECICAPFVTGTQVGLSSSLSSSSSSSSSTSSSTSSSSSHQITELARNKMLLHYINHHSLQPQPKIHQCFSNSHNFPLFPAFIFTKPANLNDMMSRVTAVERPLMSLAPLHCFNH